MRCSPGRGIYDTEISVNISIVKSSCMNQVALLVVREGSPGRESGWGTKAKGLRAVERCSV